MIRIERGPAPDSLTLARDEHLARARLRGRAPNTSEVTGYEVAHEALMPRQAYKCAYCELYARNEAAPVEHYRPKGRAHDVNWRGLKKRPDKTATDADREDDARFARGLPPRREGFERVQWVERSGYWWLAWTWGNLVFGCTGCNTGVKNTRFPQTASARALAEHDDPPGRESPLLLDPASNDPADDPIDHIRFMQVHRRWLPVARDGSPRGGWTIALLRLDSSPALLTAYGERVRALENAVASLDTAHTAGSSAIRGAWDALLAAELAPHVTLLGLTYDWLDARYPEAWRKPHGLSLPKPTLRMPDEWHASLPIAPPDVADLPDRVADLVRVARNFQTLTGQRAQPSVEQMPLAELVAEVLKHRPAATDQDLAVLLNRSVSVIRGARTDG